MIGFSKALKKNGATRPYEPMVIALVPVAQPRVFSGSAVSCTDQAKVFSVFVLLGKGHYTGCVWKMEDPLPRKTRRPTSTAADRQKRRSALQSLAKGLLLALVVSGLALGLSACSKRKDESVRADAAPAQPLTVKTALVEERPVARYVEVVGSLKADQEVVVSSEVKGIIEELPVDLGSVVHRGQLLARLAQREAQLRIDQAQAALDQARARVGMRNGSSSLEAAQNSEVRQANAALDEARLRYERARTLIKNGDISQERFDEAEIQHRGAEARYQSAQDSFHNQTALVEQRAAELQLARKQLQDTIIVAPIDGAVSARHVTRGEYIRSEAQIVTLVRSNPLRLQAVVPEVAVASVRLNQSVTLAVDAYPGKTFSGVISRISPALDEKARTLTLEATVPNADGELKPGLFASVRLLVARESPALMVPSNSLLAFAGLTKVYVVEGNRAVERVVKTGLREGGYVEILEGAKAGERVAVENLGKLSNGAVVKGKES
jgi:RND family efflux transporter MFP subunit